MKKITRRNFLKVATISGVTTALAACGATSSDTSVSDANSTNNESSTAGDTSEGEIVLRIVDWSDSTATMREAFHEKFIAEHPGVKIEYSLLTIDQFQNTIITSIKSGDAPDLFPVPGGVTLGTALNENWYQPMDEYLDDTFFDTIDPTAFVDGVTVSEGRVYTLPENASVVHNIMFYNKDILANAGISEPPKTYSEFISACKTITEQGGGSVYGWIESGQQIARLDYLIRGMTGVAGGKITQQASVAITVDGKASFDSPETIAALGMFKQLVEDGSMHPETLNINAPVARELFAQGQAAFLAQGMWCIPTWGETYPDLNYGAMALPVPDDVTPGTYGIPANPHAPWMGIYSQSKNPEMAAEYIRCLYSEEYGYEAAKVAAGNSVSLVTAVNEPNMTNEVMKEYYAVATENTRIIPIATTRDTQAYDFYVEVKAVEPGLSNIFQGVLSNSIPEPESFLTTLSEQSTVEWQRACDAIGLDFGVFDFPNWDMTKDYTAEDYAAL